MTFSNQKVNCKYLIFISIFFKPVLQGLNAQAMNLQDDTLKPVIPPFLPPPTFDRDRPKMPPVSTKEIDRRPWKYILAGKSDYAHLSTALESIVF